MRTLKRVGWAAAGALAAASTGCDFLAIPPELANLPVVPVGRVTTRSVVLSVTLIVVADMIFAYLATK